MIHRIKQDKEKEDLRDFKRKILLFLSASVLKKSKSMNDKEFRAYKRKVLRRANYPISEDMNSDSSD